MLESWDLVGIVSSIIYLSEDKKFKCSLAAPLGPQELVIGLNAAETGVATDKTEIIRIQALLLRLFAVEKASLHDSGWNQGRSCVVRGAGSSRC